MHKARNVTAQQENRRRRRLVAVEWEIRSDQKIESWSLSDYY